MAEFVYRAAKADGTIVSARLTAPARDAALRQLRGQGLTPISLDTADGSGAGPAVSSASGAPRETGGGQKRAAFSLFHRERKPGFEDVHGLTGELSIMLRAGLPLDRALKVLIGMSDKPAMRAVLEDLLKAVKGGKGLSQALLPHQALFGEFYVNMVRSGEMGGHLAEVLTQLAEHLERVKALRESVISALIYPVILVVVAVVSVFLLLGFVVPQFEPLFEDLGDGLPLPTKLIVQLGRLVSDWGALLVIVIAAAVWLLRRWLSGSAGKTWWDTTAMRLPLLGLIVRKYEITRFARSMGTLLGNGVPIVTAIKIASDTMGNLRLRNAIATVAPSIKQGGRMADALETSGLFTPLALNMVRLGEETGRLDEMLLEVARVHDGEVQAGVKRALTLVEPLLILTLGAVIAAIIISILMGILSINNLAV